LIASFLKSLSFVKDRGTCSSRERNKPCIDKILGTWELELLMCDCERKNMVIGEKVLTS
jgi:hypothetical protein